MACIMCILIVKSTINNNMIKTLTQNDFINEWQDSSRKDSFSYDGLVTLYEYLEECEYGELDIVAIDCEFAEYKNIDEVLADYEHIKDIDELRDNTTVLEFEGGIIINTSF